MAFDRSSAVAEVIEAGRQFAAQYHPAVTPFFVRLGTETAWVTGFGDTAVTDAQLSERIAEAVADENERLQASAAAAAPSSGGATRSPTPAGSVTEQWARIARWLRANHSPTTIIGATPTQIAQAAESTGITWPPELIEFYEQINGFPRDEWVHLLPSHELFDLERLVCERQMELDIYDETNALHEYVPPEGTTAGTPVYTFLPEFIPFAGLDGYLLFIDTRPGDLHGCVTEFEKVDADAAGPRWISLSAMLTDLAHSLETGASFDGDRRPSVKEGKLDWQYEG
ncbi:SMI1/KNR4 family protein [Nocardia donostiensis]|nr:SMI1/KNR4 family protein [Nocardia donostiensis]